MWATKKPHSFHLCTSQMRPSRKNPFSQTQVPSSWHSFHRQSRPDAGNSYLTNMKHSAVTAHLAKPGKNKSFCDVLSHHGGHFAHYLKARQTLIRDACTTQNSMSVKQRLFMFTFHLYAHNVIENSFLFNTTWICNLETCYHDWNIKHSSKLYTVWFGIGVTYSHGFCLHIIIAVWSCQIYQNRAYFGLHIVSLYEFLLQQN